MTPDSARTDSRRGSTFQGRTAVAGVGYTVFSRDSGRSVLSLAAEACRAALTDCELSAQKVDGIASFSMFNDSVPAQAVATALGIPRLRFCMDLNLGGQAPCSLVTQAAMAIATGQAEHVLVFRAMNGRSETRIGSTRFPSPSDQYRFPIGFTAYPQYIAMWARRFMIETGLTYSGLGSVPIAQRRYAALNDRAIVRAPLDMEAYIASPFVVDPFRVPDCTSEVDGACAVLVTSIESAKGLRWPPAVIQGATWATGARSGIDMGDLMSWPDYSRNWTQIAASDLWRNSMMGPSDIDFAEIYDCFSSVVLCGLEGLGLVERGRAAAFIASGETWLTGRLPVNTHGGLLSEGYLQGMNTLAEAVLQIQRRCGSRQVPRARTCVVTSGGLQDGSALILVAS